MVSQREKDLSQKYVAGTFRQQKAALPRYSDRAAGGYDAFRPAQRCPRHAGGRPDLVQPSRNVFDIRVVSTLGLSDKDIDAISSTEGVEAVMPVKSVDCEGSYRGGNTLAVRLQQLPAYPTLAEESNMNRLVLEDGRMPEKEGECVVQVLDTASASSLRLGDAITLTATQGWTPTP